MGYHPTSDVFECYKSLSDFLLQFDAELSYYMVPKGVQEKRTEVLEKVDRM